MNRFRPLGFRSQRSASLYRLGLFLPASFFSLATVACWLSVFAALSYAQGVITTVAGNGRVIGGIGGPATSAALGEIWGVAADSAGNVYAGDRSNNQVVKISTTGILSIVAGNGIQGYSGDGGRATSASLKLPTGIAVDGSGNLYLADRDNQRIRRVSPDGVIATIAGSGSFGFAGDGGPATGAKLASPTGVVMDGSGNLYIADLNNQRVRKVDPNGMITTFAGNGVAGFAGDGGPATSASLNQPSGVAIDLSGNLYIADASNQRLRKVSPGGMISTVAGNGVNAFSGDGGPATSAALSFPFSVAVDTAGNLYMADVFNNRIRKISPGGIITTVAGSGPRGFLGDGGPATSAEMYFPRGVAVDATGKLYMADTNNGRIRSVNSDGTIATLAGTGLANFSGDGGPATSASLSQPFHAAVDAAGNLYIADWLNHRIRKVSPTGIISTVAGTGVAGYSGDGGPAVSASLKEPHGVEVDAAGNIYFTDSGNNRVRKISFVGVISTVAGNGNYNFSGDGGPATNASLKTPVGLAIDAAGNLFVVDNGSHRIRKIAPTGIITTVAGNGMPTFGGDGGPATSASLLNPAGVAVDEAGSLYIADASNQHLRKVSSGGIITTVAGGGTGGDDGPATSASLFGPSDVALDTDGNLYIPASGRIRRVSASGIISTFVGTGGAGFSGDGGPATRARFEDPRGVAVDGAGNVYVADTLNDRIRKVLAAPPAFSTAPATLNFTATAGAQSFAQEVTVSSSLTGLAWGAKVSTESGGSWLGVTPANGFAPGTISVGVKASGLAPGTYRGTVTVEAALASPPAVTVSVELTVAAALPAELSVKPSSLAFETAAGAGNPGAQSLRIENSGGGTLEWLARGATVTGGDWLVLSATSGMATAGSPSILGVGVRVAGLAPATYSGAIRIGSATTNQTATVAVVLVISPAKQRLLLSQVGLLFTGVEGGSVVPPQSFGILNLGEGVMNWTLEARTFSGGNWLSVSATSGSSAGGSLEIPRVEVGVNASALSAGTYGGLIRVRAPGADNSPQSVTVTLNVLPEGSHPGVLVRPTGLIFAARSGGSSPGSQTIRLATARPRPIEFLAGRVTFGGEWLEARPLSGTVSHTEPRTITVQPLVESLDPGLYQAALTLLFRDGSPAQAVNILLLVVPPSTGTVSAGARARGSDEPFPPGVDESCTPRRLHVIHRTLGTGVVSPVGWPSTIEAQVVDDCGNAVGNATVVARFSNGDPPVALASLRDGLYVGTWQPRSAAAQVLVTVRAELPPLEAAEAQASTQASANQRVPVLSAGGTVNGASFAPGEAVAPGSIISVFGQNLAQGENAALQLPLGTVLGGVTLNVGGMDAPLFYSSAGQINAQLPFELEPNSRPQVVVRLQRQTGGEIVGVPETITVAAERPAIFARNQQGTGQGAILNQDFSANGSGNAAARGSVVQVFATGLGVTNPLVPSGQPAPGDPPAVVASPARLPSGVPTRRCASPDSRRGSWGCTRLTWKSRQEWRRDRKCRWC